MRSTLQDIRPIFCVRFLRPIFCHSFFQASPVHPISLERVATRERSSVMTMTASDVTAILGPADETLLAEITLTGATREQLAQAWAWVNSEEALVNDGRSLPAGKVAELVD